MTKAQRQEQWEAKRTLREWIEPGDTIYTVLRRVSRSGMQREISLHGVGGYLVWYTGMAARALGERIGKRGGIIVGGCGMDMGFQLVYNLGRVLYPDGFGCIGEGKDGRGGCPSNDHSNGDRDYTPHPEKDATELERALHPHWHHDGGYALRQRWL